MSCCIYLDGLLMPITPAQIVTRYRGRNQHIPLLNGGDFSRLRSGENAELSFSLSLPRRRYPFARYTATFLQPEVYVDRLLALRRARLPFRFICSRLSPAGALLADTNLRVCVESLEVREDAEDGDDLSLELVLRECREYAAVRVAVDRGAIAQEPGRETDNRPQHTTYTVVKGDCLWNIAKRSLGNGARYTEIYDLNRDVISNPNRIYPGQVLTLPAS